MSEPELQEMAMEWIQSRLLEPCLDKPIFPVLDYRFLEREPGWTDLHSAFQILSICRLNGLV